MYTYAAPALIYQVFMYVCYSYSMLILFRSFMVMQSCIKATDLCLYLKILAFLYTSEFHVIFCKSARNNIKNILPLKQMSIILHDRIIL